MSKAESALPSTISQAQIDAAWGAILDGTPLAVEVGSPETARRIAAEIRQGETFEDIFGERSLPSWGDNLDHPFQVLGFQLSPSGYDQGSAVYAIVEAVDLETGETLRMSTGGRNVLSQLMTALERGMLPAELRMIAKRTGAGNDAYWLRPA
jgi:hypothetical protein